MTYQTDEEHLTNLTEYFVEAVKLVCYCLNTHLQLRVFTNNLLQYLSNRTSKTLKMLRLRDFGPPRLAPYRLWQLLVGYSQAASSHMLVQCVRRDPKVLRRVPGF
jgi:hypothetical protein